MLRNIFRVQSDNTENDVHILSQTFRLSIMWDLHKLEVAFKLNIWAYDLMHITLWHYLRAISYLFLC